MCVVYKRETEKEWLCGVNEKKEGMKEDIFFFSFVFLPPQNWGTGIRGIRKVKSSFKILKNEKRRKKKKYNRKKRKKM